MAKVSGDAFNDAYNGSDGEVRGSGDYHKTGDTWFKTMDDGTELMSKSNSSNGRSRDHIHYHNNHGQGSRSAKVTKPHQNSNGSKGKHQTNKGKEGDLFDAFAKFLGF